MIKMNELRRGNLIMINNHVSLVEGVDGLGINPRWGYDGMVYDYEISLDSPDTVKPVIITEEWLVKFGFEKPGHSWNGEIFHLTEWDAFPLNWCVAMNKNNAIVFSKLKYVHQLQNLYFALTGKELEIIQP